MFKTTLYFGQNKKDGTIVTEAEFIGFLRSVVDHEFEGYTVFNGLGRWKGTSELCKVLTVLTSEKPLGSVSLICSAYCKLFNQDCVLVERSHVDMEFYS